MRISNTNKKAEPKGQAKSYCESQEPDKRIYHGGKGHARDFLPIFVCPAPYFGAKSFRTSSTSFCSNPSSISIKLLGQPFDQGPGRRDLGIALPHQVDHMHFELVS